MRSATAVLDTLAAAAALSTLTACANAAARRVSRVACGCRRARAELHRPISCAHCQSCRGDRDGNGSVASAPLHGPDGHTWRHTTRNLLEIIMHGSGAARCETAAIAGVAPESPKMPGWSGARSAEDARMVLSSIKTWWTPERRRYGDAPGN